MLRAVSIGILILTPGCMSISHFDLERAQAACVASTDANCESDLLSQYAEQREQSRESFDEYVNEVERSDYRDRELRPEVISALGLRTEPPAQ